MLRVPALVFVVVAACAPAGVAQAATLVATPDGKGVCTAESPCSLGTASSKAVTGDRVLLAPGDHVITSRLFPRPGIEIAGDPAGPRPRIVVQDGSGGAALYVQNGTVRHLEIAVAGGKQPGLYLDGGLAEDIVVRGTAIGIEAQASPVTTVVRDAVVTTTSSSGSDAAVVTRDGLAGGLVALRNVTAYAPATAAVDCGTQARPTSLVNVIARGDEDLEGDKAGCRATASNFRPDASDGFSGMGNQSGDPRFVDAAAGDLHLGPGSPAIDAGAADPLLGLTDLDGNPRVIGPAPDLGAFEAGGVTKPVQPAPAGGEDAGDTSSPRGSGAPVVGAPLPLPGAPGHGAEDLVSGRPAALGRSVVLTESDGSILLRRPGSKGFTPADGALGVPAGTVVDARDGTVLLETALPGGGVQVGAFRGARFSVRQNPVSGMTHIVLRGKLSCASRVTAQAASVRQKHKSRPLWARDRNGRYTTHGATSTATARGTEWVTTDTCTGTRTRVLEGAVDVRRRGTARAVRVQAGESRLVRAAKRR